MKNRFLLSSFYFAKTTCFSAWMKASRLRRISRNTPAFKLASASLIMGSALFSQAPEPSALARHELYWEYQDVWHSFESWSKTYQQPSEKWCRDYIMGKNYPSMLDVGCGVCPDYFGFKDAGCAIAYKGIDITPRILAYDAVRQLPVEYGHAEKIPFADKSFALVYARHLFEHVRYYKKTLSEMIRVAQQEVLVVFFLAPGDASDALDYKLQAKSALFNNRYNKARLEEFIRSHERVMDVQWELLPKSTPDGDEAIMHVYLKE